MRVRLVAALLVVFLGGCALGRSAINAGVDAGANPAQGTAVRIVSVEDARTFSASPGSPDMPSLMNQDEIGNSSITSRAVGRKRGGFGAALGDVLLQEGTTVPSLVQSAVTRGLRESGYRVLASGDAGYAQAVPVKARVEQFWSWFNPGFASVTLTNRAAVNLQGDIPALAQGRTFKAETVNSMQMVVEDDWAAIVNKGLEALATAIRDGLR